MPEVVTTIPEHITGKQGPESPAKASSTGLGPDQRADISNRVALLPMSYLASNSKIRGWDPDDGAISRVIA
ncbi:hypothetical protein CcaCcLH18_02244 [Colletotrichum camelliae]|nr:hypothetical protein CcaCcLH18_02244 [Colletotrichum camelliae]